MTQAAVAPRAQKAKVETYSSLGLEVTFTQVPVDYERSFYAPQGGVVGKPAQRSKWEVRVNGGLVGFAFYPLGVGNPWVFTSLVPSACDPYSYSTNYVRAWEPPPQGDEPFYAPYGGLMSTLEKIIPRRRDVEPDKDHGQWATNAVSEWRWKDRAHIASFVGRFFLDNRLPGPSAVEKRIARAIADKERVAQEAIHKREREARERAELQAAAQQREQERQQLRRDTLEGLQSIQTKVGADLSNFEAAALSEAIKAFLR